MINLELLYKLRALFETDVHKARSILKQMKPEDQAYIANHWYFNKTPDGKMGTRMEQILPFHEEWFSYLWKPARRWGKTFAAANNVVDWLLTNTGNWIAVAATFTDAKKVMIEGDSGIMAALNAKGYREQATTSRTGVAKMHYTYDSGGIPTITLDNGNIISFYTAEKASKMRGTGVCGIWFDEILCWFEDEKNRDAKITTAYNQGMIVLSKAKKPIMLMTSTPTPVPFLRKILYKLIKEDPNRYRRVNGALVDNPWLSEDYKREVIKQLGNGKFARQELYGEECWDTPGALWQHENIQHVEELPNDIIRTVVAVDPAVSNNPDSDETGIVVACKSRSGKYFVLADYTTKGSPNAWARRVAAAYEEFSADRVVYEANQGGLLVAETIRTVHKTIPLTSVHASKGKYSRAEPIAALYEQGKVYHLDYFKLLEEQMTSYNPEFTSGSPDRMDALVWALHELKGKGGFGFTFG